MRKPLRLVLLIILILAIISSGLYFVFRKGDTKINYALALNNFYKEKTALLNQPPQKNENYYEPSVRANSAVLIDLDQMYPLYKKDADAKVPIASITKIMTAQVALDIYKLNDEVTITEDDASIEGSKVGLVPGEKMTVENLLYGLLMVSGNDAARALANAKIPEAEFVNLMNKKAFDLGLADTYFKDTAGLDDEGRSSAFDVTIIFGYGLKNELFKQIVSTAEKTIRSSNADSTYNLENSNRLTTSEIPLEGNIGGKTGNTPGAGHTLAAAAERDGTTLVCVILGTDSDSKDASAQEARNLIEWGFKVYNFSKS